MLLPSGEILRQGARFFGVFQGGQRASGAGCTNQIGTGYSPLDGYGFIDAEAAVNAAQSP